MCGFAGFVSFDPPKLDRPARAAILKAMGSRLSYRGPDEESFYDDGHLALVFRRLAIVGGDAGKQPFLSAAKDLVLAVNGEIYNHAALWKNLAPSDVPASRSDCAVLLPLFQQLGEAAFEQVRGMFAAAFWAPHKQELTLARDRLGIKPLYIARLKTGWLFGSELKALLAHPECPRRPTTVAHFGTDEHLFKARTPSGIEGIEFLPAGHTLRIDRAGAQEKAYWCLDPHLASAPYGNHVSAYTEAYTALLQESFDEHLPPELSGVLHLSGGLDSSLLAALGSKRHAALSAFSLLERSSHLAGESQFAQALTAKLNMPWSPVAVDYRHFAQALNFRLESLEEAVWFMDAPRFDIEWLLKGELNKLIKARHPDNKVLILGQGADEFTGGYSNPIQQPMSRWIDYINSEVHPLIGPQGSNISDNGHAPYHRYMLSALRQLQGHNLWHEDRSSAWSGMEARLPFLDHRLVELCASVPANLHGKLFWNKKIIRDAAQRINPEMAWNRPKIGFLYAQDARSISEIQYQLAIRALPGFLDKYLDRADLPVARQDFLAWAEQVRGRSANFASRANILLNIMAASIFNAQIQESGAIPAKRLPAGLDIASPEAVSQLDWIFSVPPIIKSNWQADDLIELPPGSRIEHTQSDNKQLTFTLLAEQTVVSTLHLPPNPDWRPTMLKLIGSQNTRSKTVESWCQALGIPRAELSRTLDMLYSAGFLTPPRPALDFSGDPVGGSKIGRVLHKLWYPDHEVIGALVDKILDHFPCSVINSTARQEPEHLANAIFNLIIDDIHQFSTTFRPGWFRIARFVNSLRWRLIEASYNEELAGNLGKLVILKISKQKHPSLPALS